MFILQACGFKSKYWKSHNLDCVHQLQDVSIALSTGYVNNALEWVRYILENASNLEQMVIYYLPSQFYVIEKVNKIKKISSAVVLFKERGLKNDDVMGKNYYWVLHSLHYWLFPVIWSDCLDILSRDPSHVIYSYFCVETYPWLSYQSIYYFCISTAYLLFLMHEQIIF